MLNREELEIAARRSLVYPPGHGYWWGCVDSLHLVSALDVPTVLRRDADAAEHG